MNLFGLFENFQDLDSRPINADGFQHYSGVVSNDDARDIKVEAVSEPGRFSKLIANNFSVMIIPKIFQKITSIGRSLKLDQYVSQLVWTEKSTSQ